MLSLMQLMYFVVLELSRLQAILTHSINKSWLNGFVRDKRIKEDLMVDHKNYRMYVILGGFTQLFV